MDFQIHQLWDSTASWGVLQATPALKASSTTAVHFGVFDVLVVDISGWKWFF